MAYDNNNTCAVWKKKDKTGKTYLSIGGVTPGGETFSFNCFENSFKEKDTHPDFRSSKPKEEKQDKGFRGTPAGDEDIPF